MQNFTFMHKLEKISNCFKKLTATDFLDTIIFDYFCNFFFERNTLRSDTIKFLRFKNQKSKLTL